MDSDKLANWDCPESSLDASWSLVKPNVEKGHGGVWADVDKVTCEVPGGLSPDASSSTAQPIASQPNVRHLNITGIVLIAVGSLVLGCYFKYGDFLENCSVSAAELAIMLCVIVLIVAFFRCYVTAKENCIMTMTEHGGVLADVDKGTCKNPGPSCDYSSSITGAIALPVNVHRLEGIGSCLQEDGQHCGELLKAIKRNRLEEVRILLSSRQVDLMCCHDNLLNYAIEHADVLVLAEVLGVEYPVGAEKEVIVSKEIYPLLNKESPSIANVPMTPIMTASYKGNIDGLTLLLLCGANVNAKTVRTSERAVDYSLDQGNPQITLHLLENDSLFPNLKHSVRRAKFDSFKEQSSDLNKLLEERKRIHDLLKNRKFDSSIQETLDKGKYVYFVNGEGKSALFTAAVSENYEAWAFLTSKGMKCITKREDFEVEEMININRDPFLKELEKYLYSVENCHVQKMVARSLTFGEKSNQHNFAKKIEGFYKYLNEEDLTSLLLQVLQDHVGLEIIFATDLDSLNKILPVRKLRTFGLTETKWNRVYVSAMESDAQSYEDLVSNLGHELAHMVMFVVFENCGLPYRKVEDSRKARYGKIVEDLRKDNRYEKCDVIIKRVYEKYQRNVWEHELIVRVPEMIAKYRGKVPDGVNLLNQQAPELLKYYEDVVMYECCQYATKLLTRNRIRGKDLIHYQKFLSDYEDNRVQTGNYKEFEYCVHNQLKVMWVSNLQLGRSHLRAKFQREGKAVDFLDWSQFLKCKDLFMTQLKRHEVEYFALIWDREECPTFCKNTCCWRDTCPAKHIQDMTEYFIMLVDRDPPNLTIRNNRIEYTLHDLSDHTKRWILRKGVKFGGWESTLKDIALEFTSEDGIHSFLDQILGADEINDIIKVSEILIGQPVVSASEENKSGGLTFNKNHFLPRSLSMKCIKLSTSLIGRNLDCTFLISGIETSDVGSICISKEFVTSWKQELLHDASLAKKRCFLLEAGSDEYKVFEDTVTYYKSVDGDVKRVYLLKYCSGYFSVIESAFTKEGVHPSETMEEDVTFSDAVQELLTEPLKSGLADVEHQDLMPFVLADDPGSGKSVFLNWLAVEIKKKKPAAWVTSVDLKVYINEDHFKKFPKIEESEDQEQSLDFLYEMARNSGTSFERRIFELYCGTKKKLFLLLDGYDEICPDFRGQVTSFVRSLKKHTMINLLLSTRLHEKNHIVRALNGVCSSLVPLKENEQVQLLDTQWNDLLKKLSCAEKLEKLKNLKCELEHHLGKGVNSSASDAVRTIEERMSLLERNDENRYIDLKAVAEGTLRRTVVSREHVGELIQSPLHLQIIGTVVFEGLFSVGDTWSSASLYQKVYESKMKHFNSQKAQAKGTVPANKSGDVLEEIYMNVLEKLACNVLRGPKTYELQPKELQFAVDIGLATHLLHGEGNFQFVHRTFAEFFFARWLVKKAGDLDVTKFWLQRLFLEKGLSRVREFQEDILCEREGTCVELNAFIIKTQKLTERKDLSESQRKTEMHRCMCGIIYYCNPECLRFVVDSFGEGVAMQCFKEFQGMRWHWKLRSDILSWLEDTQSKGERIENALHFAIKCYEEIESFPKDRFVPLVRELLSLVDEDGLCNLTVFVCQRGLKGLIPRDIDLIGDSFTSYSEVMADFLTGKHKETFRENVRRQLLDPKNMFRDIRDGQLVVTFSMFPLLADAFLQESECNTLMLQNIDFFDVWCTFVSIARVDDIARVWNLMRRRLSENGLILGFIKKEDSSKTNILVNAVSNHEPSVPILFWGVAKELFGPQESKQWVIETFKYLNSSGLEILLQLFSLFEFLDQLLKDEWLDEEEVLDILLVEDSKKRRPYLQWGMYYSICQCLLSFFHFASHISRETVRKLYSAMDFKYYQLILGYLCKYNLPKILIPFVDEEFDGITSQPSFNQFHLVPIHHLDKLNKGLMDDGEVLLKTFIVVFYKCLQYDDEFFGKEFLLGCLSDPGSSMDNIVHQLLFSLSPAIALSYTSSVLLMFLNNEDLEGLLYEGDEDGNTVFHKSVWTLMNWGYLYDVARVVSGFEALSKVHLVKNNKGESVLDCLVKTNKS